MNEETAAGLRRTLSQDPGPWQGPSWSISASADDGATAFAASGYFERLWRWEGRFAGMEPTGDLPVGCPRAGDSVFTSDGKRMLFDRSWTAAELNIELPSLGPEGLEDLLDSLLPGECQDVMAAVQLEGVPVTAHVPLQSPAGTSVVDFEVPTLPSRRGDRDRPLSFGARRARIVVTHLGPVVLWGEIEGPWDVQSIPWPHHAMPSRSLAWDDRCFTEHRTPPQRLNDVLAGFCDHVRYQQATWQVEHEHWEQGLFSELGVGASTFEGLDLVRYQRELVTLADFLGHARTAQRAMTRRPSIDPPLMEASLRTMLLEQGSVIGTDLDEARKTVRESFALVANIASGQQSLLAEQQRDATNQLQGLVTVATSVLLVPALVVAVYGANLRELSTGSRGDLWSLLLLMVASALGASVLVRVVVGRRLLRSGSKRLELGLAIALALLALVSIVSVLADVVPGVVGMSAGTVAGVSSISAFWSALRLRGDESASK